MCGISGFFGRFDEGLLSQMSHSVAHRGPDDHGEFLFPVHDHVVGLAHQRLSIIDLSTAGGHQPCTTHCHCCSTVGVQPQDSVWLIYNGELYNYRELRKTLECYSHQFSTQSDTEVLLHMYCEYGLNFLNHLEGIFAFAIYDGRNLGRPEGVKKGDMIVARDHFGVKPLYYSQVNSGFLFASELKALLQCPSVRRDFDLSAVQNHLTYLWCPAPETILTSVKKLEPGHFLQIRQSKIINKKQYYDIPVNTQKSQLSEGELIKITEEKIYSAVNKQMVSDVPIGAFLSGGLDSSAIVAMMKKTQPDTQFDCFTIAFKGSERKPVEGFAADLPYAEKVAQHLGVKLNTIMIDSSIKDSLSTMLYYLDEPIADPAPINVFRISELAHQQGLKVLMSGAGGDDIFTGYRRHYALMQEKYWAWLPKLMRQTLLQSVSEKMIQGRFFCQDKAVIRRFSKAFSYAGLAEDERIESYFHWGHATTRKSLLSPAALNMLEHHGTENTSLLVRHPQLSGLSLLDKMLYLECQYFLPDHNLCYTDKMSMANGIETRVPLLDLELVKWAFKIPNQFKQKGKIGKYIFKKAMEPYLPKEVIYRPKTGFGAPLRTWLNGDLRELVFEYLSKKSIENRGLFNYDAVARLIQLDQLGRIDAGYTIFSLLCMEMWSRMFVDSVVPKII